MSRPTPTLSEAVTVAEWWKTRNGQAIRVSLSTYAGRNLIDLRTWHTVDGKLKPTAKGLATDIKHLPRLRAALVKAESKARSLGLIENDAEGDQ